MITIAEFSPNPLRQVADGPCMFISYACAVSALSNVDEQNILHCLDSFIGQRDEPALKAYLALRADASGYDLIEKLHYKCVTPHSIPIQNKVELYRVRGDLRQLQEHLKNSRATAMLALSYPHGRKPHSIAIAYDASIGFFIRDSAQPNEWRVSNLTADAIGSSVPEALANLDATATHGKAIVFLEKPTPPTVINV